MLADPILTNCWGAELSAPGFTRPEFKPSQSIRPVPIIRAAGQTAWLGCNAQDGLPSAVVRIGASRVGKKAARRGDGPRAGRRISGLHPISFHLGVAEISVFEVLRPVRRRMCAHTSGH